MGKHKLTIAAMGGIILCLTAGLIVAIQSTERLDSRFHGNDKVNIFVS